MMKGNYFIILLLLVQVCNATQKLNVLFVMADDMRAETKLYAQDDDTYYKDIITPNLDKFAETSLTFTRAYCQMAICSPSRASLMTGRRIDTVQVYDLDTYWRDAGGKFTTIAQYFKESGYTSLSIGKIFHSGVASGKEDRAYSWSEKPYVYKGDMRWKTKEKSWVIGEPNVTDDYPLQDTEHKNYAIQKLRELAPDARSGDQPFFIGLGFKKPHLKLLMPREHYDRYANHSIGIASNPNVPFNYSEMAYSNWPELRQYGDIKALNIPKDYNTTLPDDKAIEIRRAYYATVTWIDSLFGEVMDELDALNLTDNTVVAFTSDHGYELGEHSSWTKHTNEEVTIKVPFMIRWPGMKSGGKSTAAFIELVDLMPTLADLAGLDAVPLCPENSSDVLLCHEGHSLKGVDDDPDAEWKEAAFFQYSRGSKIGYGIRTKEFKYVRWVETSNGIDWDDVYNEELYDMIEDPKSNINVVGKTQYGCVREELIEKLKDGWRKAAPA